MINYIEVYDKLFEDKSSFNMLLFNFFFLVEFFISNLLERENFRFMCYFFNIFFFRWIKGKIYERFFCMFLGESVLNRRFFDY